MVGGKKTPEDILKETMDEKLKARYDSDQEIISDLRIENTDLRKKNTLLEESKSVRLKTFFDNNVVFWDRSGEIDGNEETIHIDDPLYQQVLIEKELVPIYRHPIVQRLAHIKQLSFSYLTFPTSTHSRLSHSLGVCRNAELAITSILNRGIIYTSKGTKKIDLSQEKKRQLILTSKLAALLHDLGHGPFGHGLDIYVRSFNEDQDPSPDKFFTPKYIENYLGETIKSCGFELDTILRILGKNKTELEGYDALISNIIDSPLDVDRMDYLVRDSHMTGLLHGTVNIQALINRMAAYEEESGQNTNSGQNKFSLVFEKSAIPYITQLLYSRDSMYLNCYEYPVKVAAEKMLVKAVAKFATENKVSIDKLVLLTDRQLLGLLLDHSNANSESFHYASAIVQNSPFEEVYSISPKKWEAWEKEGNNNTPQEEDEDIPPQPSKIFESWETDRLILKSKDFDKPAGWEETIAKNAGLSDEDKWKVLITVPSTGMTEPKFDQIKLLTSSGEGFGYKKLDQITGYWEKVLKHMAIERHCFRVFVSIELSKEVKQKIKEAATDLFEA